MHIDDQGFQFVAPRDYRDVDAFYARLLKAAASSKFTVKSLGDVGYPLLYLERKARNPSRKVMISAGFHGDEVAGVWGALHFMESGLARRFESTSMAFLPLVNPTGMHTGSYNNALGEMPNSGYCHNDWDPYGGAISREGKMLIDNLGMLTSGGIDGFLTLHENVEEEKSYLYAFEHSDSPGFLAKRLKSVLGKNFELIENGVVDIDGHFSRGTSVPKFGARLKDGIVLNLHDGSFEDMMFHDGTPYSICTETPGKKDVLLRVATNSALIYAFLDTMESTVPVRTARKTVPSRQIFNPAEHNIQT